MVAKTKLAKVTLLNMMSIYFTCSLVMLFIDNFDLLLPFEYQSCPIFSDQYVSQTTIVSFRYLPNGTTVSKSKHRGSYWKELQYLQRTLTCLKEDHCH